MGSSPITASPFGLGSGERLNEHVVGLGWPGVAERHERLCEAAKILQGLLKDELAHYRGMYLLIDNARLYVRSSNKPPVVIAAGGPQAAALAGEKADGLAATEAKTELVEAFPRREARVSAMPEVGLCWARSEEEGRKIAHKYFRWSVAGWPVQAELPDTKGFEAASKHVTPENVGEKTTCGPSVERHPKAVRKYIDAGFDHIVLTQIGPDQP